jgi:hypothetical protein
MEYNILIETDFFNLLNAGHKNKGGNALENSYREFIKVVVDLCSTNVKQAVFALSYAETELDFLHSWTPGKVGQWSSWQVRLQAQRFHFQE